MRRANEDSFEFKFKRLQRLVKIWICWSACLFHLNLKVIFYSFELNNHELILRWGLLPSQDCRDVHRAFRIYYIEKNSISWRSISSLSIWWILLVKCFRAETIKILWTFLGSHAQDYWELNLAVKATIHWFPYFTVSFRSTQSAKSTRFREV